jgi:hypothetical protein
VTVVQPLVTSRRIVETVMGIVVFIGVTSTRQEALSTGRA